ncbi:hypothetical protein EYF80_028771 [Liparis tanakae]|uniref:Uncharacterized protein n=1 Tax=Liparis tanakae TaxID=230148 RepID=A0A4Z2H7L3_9TELE|nr:hypothetical protein EYF80_028771 [Liparis tanakae]
MLFGDEQKVNAAVPSGEQVHDESNAIIRAQLHPELLLHHWVVLSAHSVQHHLCVQASETPVASFQAFLPRSPTSRL